MYWKDDVLISNYILTLLDIEFRMKKYSIFKCIKILLSYFRPLVTDKNDWAEIKISEKIQTSFCETAFGLLKRQTKVSQFEQHIIKHIYKVKGKRK